MDPSSRYNKIIPYIKHETGPGPKAREGLYTSNPEEEVDHMFSLSSGHKEFFGHKTRFEILSKGDSQINCTVKVTEIGIGVFEVHRAYGSVDLYHQAGKPIAITTKRPLDEHDVHAADAKMTVAARNLFGASSVECYINPNRKGLDSIPREREIAVIDMLSYVLACESLPHESLHIICPDGTRVYPRSSKAPVPYKEVNKYIPSAYSDEPHAYTQVIRYANDWGIKVVFASGDSLIYKKIQGGK